MALGTKIIKVVASGFKKPTVWWVGLITPPSAGFQVGNVRKCEELEESQPPALAQTWSGEPWAPVFYPEFPALSEAWGSPAAGTVSRMCQVLCACALGTVTTRRRQTSGDKAALRFREFYWN